MSDQVNLRFSRFEHELLDPLRGHALSDVEQLVASALLDASRERPVSNERLRDLVGAELRIVIDDREMKAVILRLREEHLFPIMAVKTNPAGYWWCRSAEEMKAYYERVRKESLARLNTVSKVIKVNFPELAGQLGLDFEKGLL